MFIVCGMSPVEKRLPFTQQGTCPCCGRMARFELWMTANGLMLFFVPVFRFGKRYYLVTSCCGAYCELPAELGRAAARGELEQVNLLAMQFTEGAPGRKQCPNCGFTADPAFRFCPNCGTRL